MPGEAMMAALTISLWATDRYSCAVLWFCELTETIGFENRVQSERIHGTDWRKSEVRSYRNRKDHWNRLPLSWVNDCLCSFNFVVVFFILFSLPTVFRFLFLSRRILSPLRARCSKPRPIASTSHRQSLGRVRKIMYTLIFSILFLSCLR